MGLAEIRVATTTMFLDSSLEKDETVHWRVAEMPQVTKTQMADGEGERFKRCPIGSERLSNSMVAIAPYPHAGFRSALHPSSSHGSPGFPIGRST